MKKFLTLFLLGFQAVHCAQPVIQSSEVNHQIMFAIGGYDTNALQRELAVERERGSLKPHVLEFYIKHAKYTLKSRGEKTPVPSWKRITFLWSLPFGLIFGTGPVITFMGALLGDGLSLRDTCEALKETYPPLQYTAIASVIGLVTLGPLLIIRKIKEPNRRLKHAQKLETAKENLRLLEQESF